jgi:hypothetical protein
LAEFSVNVIERILGCKKHDGIRDFSGCTEAAKRNSIGNHLLALFADLRRSQQVTQAWRVDGAWAVVLQKWSIEY